MSLLATFLSVLLCLLSLLISDSRFDLVWFRLSCDHGWIRSESVHVRKTTTTTTTHTHTHTRNRKIVVDAVRETGETRVESEKNVEKKGLVQ